LFAREGASIVVADVLAERAERVAASIVDSGGRGVAAVFDVSDPEAVAARIPESESELGPIDILVNNAAISLGDDVLTIEPDVWDRNLAIVLRGPYLCARAVLPGMIERRRGSIVNISSVNGMTGLGEEPYSAAKSGLLNLTQNMAIKYGQFGIRVNAISPGTVRTPIWSERLAESPDVFETLSAWYPLQRVGEPDDIANAALFLVSDEASFITGVNLPVDGGLTAGSYGMNRQLQGDE
jgi:NAD(P)-dependent dehydrogenase (short-subunit alcohol dehydrogenase family)